MPAAKPAAVPVDAPNTVTLLKADHRKVDGLFEEFDAARRFLTRSALVAAAFCAMRGDVA